MKTPLYRIVVLLALTGSLAACGRKDNSIEPASNGSAAPPGSAVVSTSASGVTTSTALPGVVPAPTDLPAGNTGTGPGQGQTAIGGLNATQESGGQKSGTPAPTGGDAAPAKNSSK